MSILLIRCFCFALFDARLVETNNVFCNTVEENCNGSAEFSLDANNGKRRAVAEVSAPLVVVLFATFPHRFQICIRLVALVQACEHNTNAKEHEELVF